MSTAVAACPTAIQFLRKLRGGSQPILVRADDGELYVVKCAENLQGGNLLFNESMGAELYRQFGLLVPEWRPVLLTREFLDEHRGTWIESENGLRRPAEGLCFGSQYLGASDRGVCERLPATAFPRIWNRADFWLSWLIDICAEHTDNRQALFLASPDGGFVAHFIDHGHLFGGPRGGARMHFAGSRYLDGRIYPHLSTGRSAALVNLIVGLDPRIIRERLMRLPDEWKTGSALDGLERCLCRMSNRREVAEQMDRIAESVAKKENQDSTAKRLQAGSRIAVARADAGFSAIAAYRPHRFA